MDTHDVDRYVARDELDVEEVRELVRRFVNLDIESGVMRFTDEYGRADLRTRLLVPLLGLYVLEREGGAASEAISPIELAEIAESPVGEAYPVIRELEQEGLIENTGKEYRIVSDERDGLYAQFDATPHPRVAD
jgi:hypothetical protein